jgi:putative spermidine/putrescine transport system permease protein
MRVSLWVVARTTGRLVAIAAVIFMIFGPLSSFVLWSFAEKWYWPHIFPQQVGLFYWLRIARSADMLRSLQLGVLIALLVTGLTLLTAVPLGYALARWRIPAKPIVLMLFLLPQAFPQLPVFANAAVILYRLDLGATVPGVVLIHMVGALVFAVWTMTAVFKSIPLELEEAAVNLGASRLRTFASVALPLAMPGIVASALLVFLYSLDEFTGTLVVGAPFVITLPVFMYNAAQGYELQVASITALLLMIPGIVLLLLMERYLKAEYLAMFGKV